MIFLAIALALALPSSEILTQYKRKILKHIVNRYLLFYLFINSSLAAIVYKVLPDVASFLLSEEIASAVKSDSWIRAFIAGIGYAIVLRSKVRIIKIGKDEISAGFDTVYQALSDYLLRHIDRSIKIKEIRILQDICKDFPDIETLLRAVEIIRDQVTDVNERNSISSQIKEIKESQGGNDTKCISLARILLDQLSSEEEVRNMLKAVP